MEVFEEQYQEGMEMEEALVLGLRALKKATEEENLNPKSVEIGVVRRGSNFRRLDDTEVEAVVAKANSA